MDGYKLGDHVIFRKGDSPLPPGHPAKGLVTSGVKEQFWTVKSVRKDGTIDVLTKDGKTLRLKSSSPRLRKASLLTELLYGRRFPRLPHRIGT